MQEAKQRFSELVQRALDEGPQIVTKHGKQTVAVLSIDEYRRLEGAPSLDFKEFLLAMPPIDDLELELARDPHDIGRDVDL